MKSTEELTQIAIDVLSGKVFMALDTNAVSSAFGTILMLLTAEGRDEIVKSNPQAFYEYLEKQGGRSVNGYPSFFSIQWLSAEEWTVFFPIYDAKRQALYGADSTEQPHEE